MKVASVKSIASALTLVAVASISARANTITPSTFSFTPGDSITYYAELKSGELHAGDGFTIYDIGGFLGFGELPVDWVASSSMTGSPFGSPPLTTTDELGYTNVHFTYEGPSVEHSLGLPTTFIPFVVLTSSVTLVTDDWVSIDHLLATKGVIDGGVASVHTDQILVPVPDGGGALTLLGSALLAMGVLGRTFARR
jgi:hypothetical protein